MLMQLGHRRAKIILRSNTKLSNYLILRAYV